MSALTARDIVSLIQARHSHAVLFLRGRLYFHHADGRRADHNSGAPSVLVAYGDGNTAALQISGLEGHFVHLGRNDD